MTRHLPRRARAGADALLRWGAALLAHQERWTALTVGLMLASAASGLWWLVAEADRFSLTDDLPLAVGAACTYTALTAAVAVRRRIDRPLGAVVVAALLVLMLAEGTSYPDPSLRWLCLVLLTVLPLLAVILVGVPGAVLTTAASVGVALVVAAGLPGTPEVRSYVAATVASLVCVPVLIVGVLLHQLQGARLAARRAASTDALTGLLNRRGLAEAFPGLLAEATAAGHRVTLVLADLDHFKRVNDGWGHAAGDRVLVRAAGALAATARSGDLLVRLGGEELAWVAHHRDPGSALRAAERARAAVADAGRDVPPGHPGGAGGTGGTGGAGGTGGDDLPVVTASFGVAVSAAHLPAAAPGSDAADAAASAVLDALLAGADAALYRAKASGRDRVCHSPELEPAR